MDFHIHTNFSDGGKNYEEIIEECVNNDISYISITDHNTYKSCKKNNSKKIRIINGMELDVTYKKNVFHMLLYNFDLNSKLLKKYYKKNRQHEIYLFNKNIKYLEKKYNILIDKNIKRNFIRNNNYFDRVRLNNFLVDLGLCNNPKEAFNKYTKELKRTKRMSITMEELFMLANDSNGIVSLAHPLKYNISFEKMKEIILELKNTYNLKVIEAINNHQTLDEEKELIKFCKENGLLISAGSDAHYKLGMPADKVVGKVLGRNINECELTFLILLKE